MTSFRSGRRSRNRRKRTRWLASDNRARSYRSRFRDLGSHESLPATDYSRNTPMAPALPSRPQPPAKWPPYVRPAPRGRSSPGNLASASAQPAGRSRAEQQTCDCHSRNRGAVRRPLRIGDSPRTGLARRHEPYRELAMAAAAHHPSLGAQGTGRALRYAVVVSGILHQVEVSYVD
jgi:hypothetical protein